LAGPVIHIHLNTDQLELIEGLLHHHDRHERLSAVVERTRHTPRFSASDQTSHHRVAGCSSTVWLVSEIADGRCHFRSDAESPVVRGLVALLADFHDGSTPAEIINNEADPLELLDLKRGLSPTRRHGLAAVSNAIRNFASAHLIRSPGALPRNEANASDTSP